MSTGTARRALPGSLSEQADTQVPTRLEVWRVEAGREAQSLCQPQRVRQVNGAHEAAVDAGYSQNRLRAKFWGALNDSSGSTIQVCPQQPARSSA